MLRILNERVLVLFALLIAGLALLFTTFGKEYADVGSAHSPVFFPQIILSMWIGLSVLAIGQAILQGGSAPSVFGWIGLVVLALAALVYTNVLTTYGFFLTSVAFSVLSLIVFRVRSPLMIGLYALAVPGTIVGLFNHVLKMPLPTSPFTHWF
ncbi:MAG: tripartite tricarboxylate transporter TctB family protein [Pseudomonadota bacterium]